MMRKSLNGSGSMNAEMREDVAAKIRGLEGLEYGWGDQGTELPLRPDIPKFVCDVVLASPGGAHTEGVPPAFVGLSRSGTLMLEFSSHDRVLILEVPCWGVVCYSKRSRATRSRVEGTVFVAASPAELLVDEACELEEGTWAELDAALAWLVGKMD
jgi:hypothetical protein